MGLFPRTVCVFVRLLGSVCVCVCAGSGTLSRLLPAQAAPLPGQPDRSSGAVRGEPCGGSVLTSSLKFERHHLRKIRMRALTHSRRLDA